MLTLIVAIILMIYGMPLFGMYLMVDRRQQGNRVLGAVLTILGLIVWGIYGLF